MTATTLSKPRLFGMVALSLGFITKEQLEENLEIQSRFSAPIRLGDIMVARGVLSTRQLREVLRVQTASCNRAKSPRPKTTAKRLIGEIMLEQGFVEGQTLAAALKQQVILRNNGMSLRIGQILIANKQITRIQLDEALALQSAS